MKSDRETRVFYMDGVAWQHEFGNTHVALYDSLEELKEFKKCWSACGVVKVTCEAEWVIDQNLTEGMKGKVSDHSRGN